MPVKSLQNFCENIPGILVEVNLKELIKQELSETGDRPKIVVDESSLSFIFNSTESSSYILNQPAVTKVRIERFIEGIISSGANVIVVLRGEPKHQSPNEWFLQKKEALSYVRKQYETLGEPEKIYYRTLNAASIICCKKTLASISNEHYRVSTSVGGTVKEVVKIAVKEKCLAVIGQNSNYLIYEGIRFYILVESLDIETFNCKFYNRNALLQCLALKSYQLPLFATLCGNEIVPCYNLRYFHKRISGGKLPLPISVAEKVKNTSSDPYEYIEELVKSISHNQVTRDLIKKSLDMFLNFGQLVEEIQPVNKLLKFASERVRKCDWSYILYRIFVEKEYYSQELTGFCNDLTTFELLRPLRKNLYGVLFPSDDVLVKEYFLEEMLLHNYKKAIPQTPVYKISNLENPGLIELFRNRTPGMDILRWDLFLSCVSKTLRFFDIRIIPENFVFPVMALHYLQVTIPSYFQEKKVFKKAYEVEAFLLGALLFEEFPKEHLENIEESKPDLWELQLNTLYLDVCFTLILINEACGFVISKKKACICSFYDGKLIHWIYTKMKRGTTCDEFFEDNMVLEALFYTLKDLLMTE